MSESEGTRDSSSRSEKEWPGSPPPPNDEESSTHSPLNSLEVEKDNVPSAASPPSSDNPFSSPPPEQSVPPPPSDDLDSPPPEINSPSPPPPPTPTPTPPASASPDPIPNPNQQSPPPTPPKQQPPTPSPPASITKSSPPSLPSLSPPSLIPPINPSGSSSPSPPPSPPTNFPGTPPQSSAPAAKPPNSTSNTAPPYAFSPPPINGTTISRPGFSPQALAPPSEARNTPSNSTSSHSGGSSNSQNNHYHHVLIIGAALAGFFTIAFVVSCFFLRRRKNRGPANYMPPPTSNFSVTTDAHIGNSPPMDSTNHNSQLPQHSNMGNSFGSQRAAQSNPGPGPDSGIVAAGSKTLFSYEELMEMTDGFSRQNLIGEGGFGCVYKGRMPDGRTVAVKQLKAGSGQGEREFRAEVEIISRVHHRHLVSLVGYCVAENHRLLIYEFVPNKTLEYHLHANELPVLEWVKRVKIAVGAAKGLSYLHEDCHPKIIHRDIKSANILLEADFEAQVADFGLAKLNDTARSHVSTRVMGTFGYLAPEYASSGKLTDRSDVFSFGVVLLELITGRKSVDPTQPLGDESLVEWARPLLINALETGDLGQLVDPRLEKRYVESEMFRMIEAAAACVRHSAAKRPRMALVVRALDFEGESDLSNGVKFGQSTAYDSGQYSQEILKFRRMALAGDSSSEFDDMYNSNGGPYSSRELVSHRGNPDSRKSPYSSGEFTSEESETQAFKPSTAECSADASPSGNYGGDRFRCR